MTLTNIITEWQNKATPFRKYSKIICKGVVYICLVMLTFWFLKERRGIAPRRKGCGNLLGSSFPHQEYITGFLSCQLFFCREVGNNLGNFFSSNVTLRVEAVRVADHNVLRYCHSDCFPRPIIGGQLLGFLLHFIEDLRN